MSIHAPETPSLTGTGKLSARPDLRQRPRTMATDDSRMARSQAKPSTINGSTSAPFDFSPVLKARKILYQPPLPAYPESARKMGTDLNLRLFLRVQASGRVAFVDILKSSGDSITDDLARTYTAQLLFEPAAGVDEGEMAWEFRLQ